MMEGLKESILGSPNIFGLVEKGRKRSLNFVTSHDGMTLIDLVSYSEKHNEVNGEENRDGQLRN
jgi:glycogen operon protein